MVNKKGRNVMEETSKPTRQKYWSELDADEKIERMRDVVRDLKESLSGSNKNWDNFRNHKHNKEGEPVVEKRLAYGGDVCERAERKKNDEVYF